MQSQSSITASHNYNTARESNIEKFEEILALVTPENNHDTVLLQAIVDYVNVTIMMDTVKALAARHRRRKPRVPKGFGHGRTCTEESS